MYPLALHIFRRDLRLIDNTALTAALTESKEVIPCFIFDERQIDQNEYKGQATLAFMATSLQELNTALQEKNGHLYCFYGITEQVVEQLLKKYPIKAVYVNRDYTPFSKTRDQHIAQACQKHSVDFFSYPDALLHEPEEVKKPDGSPYTVFTPFFRKASQLNVAAPQKKTFTNFYNHSIVEEDTKTLANLLQNKNPNYIVQGGRQEGLTLIKRIKQLADYKTMRDFPALEGTTHLSAHNKFGTVSIREVYAEIIKQFGPAHTLINELYWRDFFTHICFHFPHVLKGAFHSIYDKLKWENSEKYFNAWCEGKTGFPIVDAGMRELNITGYMHNRVRMIVASFLTKDLHIDWRWGEKYFAQKLIDYDPAVNNGNWQWAASTGCDAQPYFRIFNPWLQQAKFDPECVYIKKWVSELSEASIKDIANPSRSIINHSIESKKTLQQYKSIKK